MNRYRGIPALLALAAAPTFVTADVLRTVANDGNLIMEDVPPIPPRIVEDLNRFQNVRYAVARAWSKDGDALYVTTRFGDVDQLHRVDMPGGARYQLTFDEEPLSGVSRQPGGSKLVFTRDAGGSEFSQIFLFDPETGRSTMLTDGESRNGAIAWDREGRRFAYQSTRRNGASNDLWVMDPAEPRNASIALESGDGSWWGPVEFSSSGTGLLALNYRSITDSSAYLVNLDDGSRTELAGGDESTNWPVAFDDAGGGFWLITSRGGEFKRLAWQPLAPGAEATIVTTDIPWDVTEATISRDRKRMAFVTNENGRSEIYLLDPATREYRRVDGIPTGIAGGLVFGPAGDTMALTLNTAQTPNDTFVLELGDDPLAHGELVRWTDSEVGGLDTSGFRTPELIEYPTFDEVGGEPRMIPAWVYKPEGEGPFPVVVSIHGGPESQSRPYFSSTYQMWIDTLGVAVVLPNVRGSAGYGKTYLKLDNARRREDSVRDIGAALDWIAKEPDLDANRVAVFGGSYGGYMVLASAVHYSERLKAAVDIVGISNFVTFLENTEDYRRDLRRVEYGDERDPQMRAFLQRISPLNNVEKIDVPMFIVQGENDPRVPVTEAIQIVEALRAADQPVWYMNALNEGHGYRRKENRDIYQQATVLFFEEYLLGED